MGFRWLFLKFPDETGSRFFKPIIFKYHFYRTWKLAIKISKMSLLVLELLAKYGFQRLFWIFLTKQEVDFSNLLFLIITSIELEILHLEYLKYLNKFSNNWQKTCFRWLFCIFNMKPEVDLSNLYFLLITTIELENLPLKFLKCLN